jgi:dolichol-phosphate mannosyltransferase
VKPKQTTLTDRVVIVPTYNEKENIEQLIRTIFGLQVAFHVLIIDDNSPDKTYGIVENLQKEFPGQLHLIKRKGKLGLGTAYIKGFEWSLENGYQYVFEMDADFSHDPKDLVRLYEACEKQGGDVAIGSRYISGVNVVNWPMGRVLLSYFASKYVRFVTGMPVQDTTAGFKCYRNTVLRAINFKKIRMIGYAFQIEMKFTAWKMGFKIVEVPIIFTDRRKGSSKMSGGIFNEAVWGVLKMKWKSFFMDYKKLREKNEMAAKTK